MIKVLIADDQELIRQSLSIILGLKEEISVVGGVGDGTEVLEFIAKEKPDIIFLCNPNNPTGITIPQDLLEEILETCAMQGIFMVVDECFLDFVKDPEKYTLKGKLEKYPGLFILKAFTKRYAIPGVRLGYGFCSDRKVLDRMEAVTQPWNVSTMAQQAGMAALKESEYVEAGRQIIFRESAWMKEKMRYILLKQIIYSFTDLRISLKDVLQRGS